MYITAKTLDDLIRRVLGKLDRSGAWNRASRGETRELRSVLLKVTNPRARLSHTEKKGKIFSALGELLWYLAKSNDLKFISYYLDQYRDESEDGATIYGALRAQALQPPRHQPGRARPRPADEESGIKAGGDPVIRRRGHPRPSPGDTLYLHPAVHGPRRPRGAGHDHAVERRLQGPPPRCVLLHDDPGDRGENPRA